MIVLFFKPTRNYVKWLIDYAAGRLILDVGCGHGQLSEKIAKLGGWALGIDPHLDYYRCRQLFSVGVQTLALPAEDCDLVTNRADSLIVIARPCHDGFVARVLEANGGNEVLYISKPDNVDVDIPVEFEATMIATPRCRMEHTYLVTTKGGRDALSGNQAVGPRGRHLQEDRHHRTD